jgi:predicted aspartyl protease
MVPHEAVSGPAPIDTITQTDDIAFKRDMHERMTVSVMISGAGPYRFMVDTGADRTAISRELANRLQLVGRRTARIHSVTGADMVATARVPLLELSRNRVELIDAPLLERRHMGADGILGVDSLRSQRVLFDFKANTLSIVPSAKRSMPIEHGAIVVTAKARKGHLILTHARANNRRINVVVDTGAQMSIGNEALRQLLGIHIANGAQTVPLLSVTGETLSAHYGRINTLDIGGATLRDLPLVFADAHTFRKLELADQPTLLLGMNAIMAFDKVSIDFAHKKLRVVLPQGSAIEVVTRVAP